MNDLDMLDQMMERVPQRRHAIEQAAPCVGCGATLQFCLERRGKDPTAPSWFGCCARGTTLDPCQHVPDWKALSALLVEIESGRVRSVDEVLLDSVEEYPRRRLVRRGRAADSRERAGLAPVCPLNDCGCSGEAHP